ncbi:hypothetical protein UCREL1_148 [Eutypa lata UCREL1]|uniref:Uncharacterized protein n=1 Tax=Eutypa lata (strain UCR-EL1) TaxID=1287681 RepID=M7T1I0_EUTLA|nr:hypothetical protein UCREL1_148 [Eutypa lata UCREL1]
MAPKEQQLEVYDAGGLVKVSEADFLNITAQAMDATATHLGHRMVFFTDGSSNNNELVIGARVTYKEFNGDFSPWTDLAYTALNTKDSNTAELLGINGALSVCNRLDDPGYKALARNLAQLVNLRVSLKFYWVKGHAAVNGNNRADRLAARAVRWSLTQSRQERLAQGYKIILTPETLPETWPAVQMHPAPISTGAKRKRDDAGMGSEEDDAEPSDDDETQKPNKKKAKTEE